MRISNLVSSLAVLAALTGCAHPIVISPNMEKIEKNAIGQPINKNVAYYIAEDVRTKEVTTPGGGGDKVSYQPYRDIETAFYKMLSNVFANVTKLKTLADVDTISKNNVSYIITPVLTTNSSSPSPFTWPPTKFSAELTCNINDAAGNPVLIAKVTGEGSAEFEEFKKDFSMSGKRATEDMLVKMQHALSNAAELRTNGNGASPVSTTNNSVKAAPEKTMAVASNQATTYAVLAAPNAEKPAVTSPPARDHANATVAAIPVSAAPMVASEKSNSNVKIQTIEFIAGVSSFSVEKIAKNQGCTGGKGAGLITPQGPVEVYRMACDSGKTFLARCELRQCSAMR